jgi:hypothetical protein
VSEETQDTLTRDRQQSTPEYTPDIRIATPQSNPTQLPSEIGDGTTGLPPVTVSYTKTVDESKYSFNRIFDTTLFPDDYLILNDVFI